MDPLRPTIFAFACVLAITAAELHPVSDKFIDLMNSKQTTWTAGRNFPPNTPLKHHKKLQGVHPDYSVNSLPRFKHDAEIIVHLPDSLTLAINGPTAPL
ncbi:Cysteine peptidase 2 cathepsin-B-like [Operophtera brumata]|uniref:Cysteine peptidase 2 cathepsin-B-like n=1 Tax=Operophtera brumata TaxID=104452 RepID=A0A0L7L6E8_OPEBR|nr:Cysteine peptidase 2 cathepsin-B-like [Operophtera brumata]